MAQQRSAVLKHNVAHMVHVCLAAYAPNLHP